MSDWPQEFRKPHVLNNQRPSLKERAKRHVSSQERREGNSAAHLALIRQLPCCVCGKAPPVDCHHLKSGPAASERSVGRRATDQWAVPLCRICHSAVERMGSRREFEWFAANQIDQPYEMAKALKVCTPRTPEAMLPVLAAHCKIKVKI
jgi:hypothetical protein